MPTRPDYGARRPDRLPAVSISLHIPNEPWFPASDPFLPAGGSRHQVTGPPAHQKPTLAWTGLGNGSRFSVPSPTQANRGWLPSVKIRYLPEGSQSSMVVPGVNAICG